ncbi:hypothetical protein ACIPJG_33520 [Streptomyces halstedii]|uniref:hypothetical protein n=1 Tax=Streptomyces halstedii TaxID=1944 RepID=UPI0037FA8AF5
MSTEPPNPLVAHLNTLTASPFIPELHTDECDDTACTRCIPRTIADLDVPLSAVQQDIARIAAEAENRHLLYDADPDATTPAFVDLHHHTNKRIR